MEELSWWFEDLFNYFRNNAFYTITIDFRIRRIYILFSIGLSRKFLSIFKLSLFSRSGHGIDIIRLEILFFKFNIYCERFNKRVMEIMNDK